MPELSYDQEVDPNCGKVMTVGEYRENVDCGGFIDYDGFGYPMKDGKSAKHPLYPSEINKLPTDATHVVWFNK